METKKALDTLRQYKNELEDTLHRFSHTRDGIHISDQDRAYFEQMVLELRDFYDDTFGKNSNNSMTFNSYKGNEFKEC